MKRRTFTLLIGLLSGPAIAFGQVGIAADAEAAPAAVAYHPFVLDLHDLPAAYTKSFGPDVVDFAGVTPDLAAIDALEPGMPFEIDLPGGQQLEAEMTSRTVVRSGQFSGHGRLADYPDGQFVLARVGDHLAMSIRIPSAGLFYMVRSLGGGEHVVLRIEESELDGCLRGVEPPDDPAHDHADHADHAAATHDAGPDEDGLGLRGGCVAPNPTWDIVVAYTSSARAAAAIADSAPSGDPGPIQSLILLYVEEANTTFENSQILARMRLVYMGEVAYQNGVSLETALGDLNNGQNGLSIVQGWRNTYYADSAMLLVDDAPGGCGLAYCCPGSTGAWGASRWDCWGATFIHEFGHNLGCAHDPDNVDCNGCNSTARGHYFTGNDSTQYGTIMSYIGQNFWHFSNPSVSHEGQATGINGQRDNVATINGRRFTFNAFRFSRFEVWVDPSTPLSGSGTFVDPYRLLTSGQTFLLESPSSSELPTMHVKASTTNQTPTFDKPMTIRACGGTVTIGQQ